jgi:NDP-sugar pyrophosphorylase family protein
MKAMILAAGFGTRLRPVTFTMPKPMVPVCNRPLVAWIVGAFVDAGVNDFVVNLHHLPDAIQRDLPRRFPGARFEFSFEPEILGTGGGVRKVRASFEHDDDFFLANGDTIQLPPIDALRRARREQDALAALTLRHPPAGDHFTPVYFENGRVTGFGKGTGEPLMFSGSHCISRRALDAMPDQEVFGMVGDLYQPLLQRGETIAAVVDDNPLWFDIGTPQRYEIASRAMLDMIVAGTLQAPSGSRIEGDSLVHESARVSGNIARSIVGERSVVEGELRDSIVWDDCRAAEGVTLDGCIVASNADVTESQQNALICRGYDPVALR